MLHQTGPNLCVSFFKATDDKDDAISSSRYISSLSSFDPLEKMGNGFGALSIPVLLLALDFKSMCFKSTQ